MSDTLLKKAKASGVFHLAPERHAAIEMDALSAGFRVVKANLCKALSMHEALLQLGAALNFPKWYGANFDALYDCLTDPDWQPAKGHVLLINGLAHLHSSDPADCATLIEVLQAAADINQSRHKPFWVMIDFPAPGLPSLPEA
jgi:RNAse (barnase) inhibitor barstar